MVEIKKLGCSAAIRNVGELHSQEWILVQYVKQDFAHSICKA